MENDCPYCGNTIEHDGKDEYVQCPSCGEISKYHAKGKLVPCEEDEVKNEKRWSIL